MDRDDSHPAGVINVSGPDAYAVRDKEELRFFAYGALGVHPETGRPTLELDMMTRSPDGHRSSALRGDEQFKNIVGFFAGRFVSITGYWISGANLAVFNEETVGIDPTDVDAMRVAASRTPSGKLASRNGYPLIAFDSTPQGSPGSYSSVELSFRQAEGLEREEPIQQLQPASFRLATMLRGIGDLEQELLKTCFQVCDELAPIQEDMHFSRSSGADLRQSRLRGISKKQIDSHRTELDRMKSALATAVEGCRLYKVQLSSHTLIALSDIEEIIGRINQELASANQIATGTTPRRGGFRHRP